MRTTAVGLVGCVAGAVTLVAGLVMGPVTAAAHSRYHHHKHHKHAHHHHYAPHHGKVAARLRYGGAPGLGWWRPGPESGKGFRFATYKGDPFGRDDYYDGDRCYYRKSLDFCVSKRIIDGTPSGRRYR